MPENLKNFPVKDHDTIHRKLGDEAVLVNLQNKFFYNLDPVGTFIWERCDGKHSLAQIAAELVKEYEVEAEVAVRDCEQLVRELVQEGILRWNPSPPESD